MLFHTLMLPFVLSNISSAVLLYAYFIPLRLMLIGVLATWIIGVRFQVICVCLGSSIISWKCKKQTMELDWIASSAEAEYRALSITVREFQSLSYIIFSRIFKLQFQLLFLCFVIIWQQLTLQRTRCPMNGQNTWR